jgi:hypothetical protein
VLRPLPGPQEGAVADGPVTDTYTDSQTFDTLAASDAYFTDDVIDLGDGTDPNMTVDPSSFLDLTGGGGHGR